MAANGISELSTKEARQLAKLALAAVDRAADGRRSVYDISELPTKYSGNDIVDNINSDGLVVGRPWGSSETPNLLSGLAIWYDTALASTINGGTFVDGANVTTLTNRATSTNAAAPSVNEQPTVQSGTGDTLNGYPVIRFAGSTGTSDKIRFTTNSFDDATGWTVVCVVNLSVTPGKNPSIFDIKTSAFSSVGTVRYNAQSQFVLYAPTGTASVINNVDPDGTWKIVTCRYDSTAAAASRYTFRWAKTARTVTNGGTPPSGSVPNTATYIDTLDAFDGDLAEQIAYNRALSDAEIIALEDYLSSKWGV